MMKDVLFRPLVLGSRERNGRTEYCVASEDCAFGPIGFQRVRDVAPGEMLIVTGELPRNPIARHAAAVVLVSKQKTAEKNTISHL